MVHGMCVFFVRLGVLRVRHVLWLCMYVAAVVCVVESSDSALTVQSLQA